MAPHSSTLAWKIPWVEEPDRQQSMGLLGVRHDWATSLSLFIFMHWRRKWQPTPVFLPGESQGQRSLVAAVYGVAQSWTRLKWLSSSSSSSRIDGWKEKKFALNSFLLGQEAFNPVKPDSKVIQLIIQLYFWGCLTVIQGVYKKQILSQTLFP